VLEKALYFAEISNGAFDPTIQPLTALWNISGEKPRLPDYAEIKAVLPLINWRDVELDPKTKTVFLKRPAMALDLGGIAKGYAADEAAVILAAKQVERAIIDLGGNILTYGSKPGNRLWKVGVQNPINGKRGVYTGIVSGYAQTVVTSGVYERFFESGGIRYHHIFNPVDGFPVRNGLLSVTIITGNSMDADGLSTTVFVLGYEKGKALIESIKGTEAIFIFEDRSVRITPGAQFSLTDTSFNLLND
jgi:thiamine biosynthesis lipoprotein